MNPDHLLLRSWTRPTSGAACSPVSRLFDLQLIDVDRANGAVTIGFMVPDPMRRPTGEPLHRAVAAMLDCALGFAAMATLEPPDTIVTATLRIESIATTTSARLVARGAVIERNDTTFFARASLHDEADACIALASATLPLVRPSAR